MCSIKLKTLIARILILNRLIRITLKNLGVQGRLGDKHPYETRAVAVVRMVMRCVIRGEREGRNTHMRDLRCVRREGWKWNTHTRAHKYTRMHVCAHIINSGIVRFLATKIKYIRAHATASDLRVDYDSKHEHNTLSLTHTDTQA
jgi:hypothetical protein